MLLPVTSSLVWWARRPAIAEFMERSTGRAPQEWDGREGRRSPRRSPVERGGCASARAGQRDLGVPAGLFGSWYRIWATSSCRNTSLPIWSVRVTVLVAAVVAAPPTPLTGLVI